jgi:GNAT superfamily N-acetyltransferase
VVIDFSKEMVILALINPDEEREQVVGLGQYSINDVTHTADVAFAVRDDFQGQGIGTELLKYLTFLAKRRGLLGFTADVLADNWRMLHVFGKMGFDIQKRLEAGAYEFKMMFKGENSSRNQNRNE